MRRLLRHMTGQIADIAEHHALEHSGPRGLRFVDTKVDGSTPPEQVAATLGLGCAVVWRSLDCAQAASVGCAWTDRLAPVSTATLHRVPFEHPVHGGVWPDEVVVGLYALPAGP